jgi:site-specific recombinase XerD
MKKQTLQNTIKEFIKSMKGIKANETIKWYQKKLMTLGKLKRKKIDNITTKDLRKWRESITQRNLSTWTIHGHIRAVRRLFKWIELENISNHNPAKRLELPPLPDEPPKGINREDIKKLINQARKNPRNHALVLLLAESGARVCGITGLSWQDISLKNQSAMVHEKGKGGKHCARRIYFDTNTKRALKKLRGKNSCGKVFRSTRSNEGLTESGIYQILERLAKKANVKKWNPHSFRHAFARDMLNEGANLAQVSQMLGHRSIDVTARFYARFADHELQQAHTKFHWLHKHKK